MTTLLLDASVIAAAFDRDASQCEPSLEILTDSSVSLSTIDLARYEVTNVAVSVWRSREHAIRMLDVLDRIGEDGGVIRSSSGLLTRAAGLAERHGLSAYDAAYVAAATSTGRRLVSCDVRDLTSKGLAETPREVRDS